MLPKIFILFDYTIYYNIISSSVAKPPKKFRDIQLKKKNLYRIFSNKRIFSETFSARFWPIRPAGIKRATWSGPFP